MEIIFEILILFLLILINGCFAMSELAVVSSRKTFLKKKMESGNKRAKSALLLAEDTGRFLPTVQIGITLIGIVAGTFSGATLSEKLATIFVTEFGFSEITSSSAAVLIVILIVTYCTLIIGELVPKRIALRYPELIAMLIAPSLNILAKITSPIVTFLEFSSNLILKLFGINTNHINNITEEEVEALITEGSESGLFMPKEKDMIVSTMKLAERPVRTIMTPRLKLEWININDNIENINNIITKSNYSRFIICDDTIDNILGIIQAKDIANQLIKGEKNLNLKNIIIKAPFFANSTPAIKIIDFLQESPIHLAIIIDEHGGVEGVVTATNILEAIIGDLSNNHNSDESEILNNNSNEWMIKGNTNIDIVKKAIKQLDIPITNEFHTIAGFMIFHFNHIPETGENFTLDNFYFEVINMDNNRVETVLIRQLDL
jgi:putative hemolysin